MWNPSHSGNKRQLASIAYQNASSQGRKLVHLVASYSLLGPIVHTVVTLVAAELTPGNSGFEMLYFGNKD